MARSSSSPTLMPTRRTPAPLGAFSGKQRAKPSFVPAVDDPLDALALQISGKIDRVSTTLTAHGKPSGGLPVFGERRAPARRAGFRTPPR